MVEITYHKEGDFFIPDLYLEKEDYEKNYIIGKYGHLRLKYLKNHKKAEYIIMFMIEKQTPNLFRSDVRFLLLPTLSCRQFFPPFTVFFRNGSISPKFSVFIRASWYHRSISRCI